jgi:hypothetical protein
VQKLRLSFGVRVESDSNSIAASLYFGSFVSGKAKKRLRSYAVKIVALYFVNTHLSIVFLTTPLASTKCRPSPLCTSSTRIVRTLVDEILSVQIESLGRQLRDPSVLISLHRRFNDRHRPVSCLFGSFEAATVVEAKEKRSDTANIFRTLPNLILFDSGEFVV